MTAEPIYATPRGSRLDSPSRLPRSRDDEQPPDSSSSTGAARSIGAGFPIALHPAHTTFSSHNATEPLLVPPLNFQTVAVGVSRSGHPNERNYAFLGRLKLKTVMYLSEDDYRPSMTTFAQREGVRVLHHRIDVNKEPFATMDEERVAEALAQLLDRRNYPILVHCNKGKYRVGCIIGILRRIQGWGYTSIFEEYARFAGTKAIDEEFIEAFDITKVRIDPEHKPEWL
ncbi:unnamed protein product [Parajaminaea phylloscopi]